MSAAREASVLASVMSISWLVKQSAWRKAKLTKARLGTSSREKNGCCLAAY
jgi:hypothetical protein